MLLPLDAGIVNGLGTELGGSALLLFIIREVLNAWKEVKLRKKLNGPSQKKHNPGNSSSDLILHLVQEHTKKLEEIEIISPKLYEEHREEYRESIKTIEEDIKNIRVELGKVKVSVARLEGSLQN